MTAAGAGDAREMVRRTPPTIQSAAMHNTALSRFSRAVSLAIAAVLASAFPASSSAAQRLAIGDLTAEPSIAGRPVTGLAWRPHSTEFSYLVRKGAGEEAVFELWLENANADASKVGKHVLVSTPSLVIPAEDKSTAEGKAAAPPDAERPPGRRRVALEGYRWSPDGQAVLLNGDHDLWIYRLPAGKLERLTHTPEDEDVPTFSPDGRKIAFVRGNDLYALDLASGHETRLTSDGSEHVLNGKLDWVYQEELGSRSGQAYQWSPDGQAIAYLRLDDGPIADAPIVDFLTVPAKVNWQRYPKAGAANPIPSFRIVGADGTVRLRRPLRARARRLRRARVLLDARLPRGLLSHADARAGPGGSASARSDGNEPRPVRRGRSRLDQRSRDPAFPAGRTLSLEVGAVRVPASLRGLGLGSRRRGGGTGTLQAITHGEWMVDHIAGVDPKKNVVYFTATEESPRRRPIYRVGLDGKGFAKLPGAAGTHTPELSEDGRFLLDTFSTVSAPPVVSLLDAKTGKSVRVVDRPDNRLSEFDLGKTEEIEVTAEDGTKLLARLLKPGNFDPSKKYPVIVYVYGGPHAQLVRDQWGPGQLLDAMLAEKGFLVWTLDNRGSWGRGHAFEAPLLRETGKHELADQLAGVRYLKSLPYVDGSRIGIWGWSYGGYMTLYSITNAPDVWKCAVAGAPVTNWKFYDTIYTERYMRTPAENPKGYEASAPLSKARSLKAKLLIIHGTADDNVHIQNSIAFIDALTKWDRPYELQVQPGQKHGFRGKTSLDFRNEAIVKFFEANL